MLSPRHGVCPLKTAGVKLTRSSEACCLWKSLQSLSYVSHQNRFNLFWEVLNTGPLLFCYMHQYMLWNTSCHSYSIRSISLYRNLLTKFLLTSYIKSRGLIFKDENVNSLSNSFSAISIYKYSWEWFRGKKKASSLCIKKRELENISQQLTFVLE